VVLLGRDRQPDSYGTKFESAIWFPGSSVRGNMVLVLNDGIFKLKYSSRRYHQVRETKALHPRTLAPQGSTQPSACWVSAASLRAGSPQSKDRRLPGFQRRTADAPRYWPLWAQLIPIPFHPRATRVIGYISDTSCCSDLGKDRALSTVLLSVSYGLAIVALDVDQLPDCPTQRAGSIRKSKEHADSPQYVSIHAELQAKSRRSQRSRSKKQTQLLKELEASAE